MTKGRRPGEGDFLPVCRADMERRGWDELDFLFISGDAYVDHPSFAAALLCRLLQSHGYRVGLVPQPDWRRDEDFLVMGRPRLGVLVGAGNLDSMLAKLTASRALRRTDAYSPGGRMGLRPDRATLVYCQRVRQLLRGVPLIIGGVEASLRRFAHYDYWSDSLRRSILADSQADLLVYGMGERALLEVASALRLGRPVGEIRDVRGTCWPAQPDGGPEGDFVELPSWGEVSRDKRAFAEAFRLAALEQDPIRGRTLVQRHEKAAVVQLPPARPLTEAEMDAVYGLPFLRRWHPMYDAAGGVPALTEVKFSVTSHRGCFGSCAFCAIHAHQGRIIQARSHDSILREVRLLAGLPDFKGYIHDIGGPTANFRHPSCGAQLTRGVCRRECLFPVPCPHLDTSHEDYLTLLREARSVPGVKRVFVRSGLRYDYLLLDKKWGRAFLEELCRNHVSGQLKVAPEHASAAVLRRMRKGDIGTFRRFMALYEDCNRRLGKKQYLVPYFMTSHPGCGPEEAVELAEFAATLDFCPEQAQDFIPTPGSLSTCMYYSGLDPFTGEAVASVKGDGERREQRALLQHRDPGNRRLVLGALRRAGRMDLAGRLTSRAFVVK